MALATCVLYVLVMPNVYTYRSRERNTGMMAYYVKGLFVSGTGVQCEVAAETHLSNLSSEPLVHNVAPLF